VMYVDSLARVVPGQEIEIVRVLLRGAASGDPHDRLRPGRRWRCRYSGTVTILLVGPAGATISVRRDAARYIQIATVENPI
jgi:hypothetical protein